MAVTGTLPGGGSERLGLGAGAGARVGATAVRTRTGRGAAAVGAAVGGEGAAVVAVVVVSGVAVGAGWAAMTFSPACSTSARGLVVGMRARATPRTAAAIANSATRRARRGCGCGWRGERRMNGRSTKR